MNKEERVVEGTMSKEERLRSMSRSGVTVLIEVGERKIGFVHGTILVEENDDGSLTGWWAVTNYSAGYTTEVRLAFDISDIVDISDGKISVRLENEQD